jgi:hypothetical protein
VPYVMKSQLVGDEALIDLRSHWDRNFFRAKPFGPAFPVPVLFKIDTDSEGRRMPTLFTTPALVARRAFYDLLVAAGVDNVESYPAHIANPESDETFEDYRLLNIVGRVACADLAASNAAELGPGIRVIDEPVLRKQALQDALIFRLAEDPVQIVVSDALAARIRAAGYDDVYLEKLAVS